jgi:hypothetical protein
MQRKISLRYPPKPFNVAGSGLAHDRPVFWRTGLHENHSNVKLQAAVLAPICFTIEDVHHILQEPGPAGRHLRVHGVRGTHHPSHRSDF